MPRAATGATSVTFTATRQLGVYRAEAILDPAAAEPGARPSPYGSSSLARDSPAPSTSPAAAASPTSSGITAPGSADEPYLFAVDLFSEEESNIVPGDGSRIAQAGADDGRGQEAGLARDNWWPPLVLVALAVLTAEWLVYERDGAFRLLGQARRALGAARPSGRRAA